jgi:hypothetical protein
MVVLYQLQYEIHSILSRILLVETRQGDGCLADTMHVAQNTLWKWETKSMWACQVQFILLYWVSLSFMCLAVC